MFAVLSLMSGLLAAVVVFITWQTPLPQSLKLECSYCPCHLAGNTALTVCTGVGKQLHIQPSHLTFGEPQFEFRDINKQTQLYCQFQLLPRMVWMWCARNTCCYVYAFEILCIHFVDGAKSLHAHPCWLNTTQSLLLMERYHAVIVINGAIPHCHCY